MKSFTIKDHPRDGEFIVGPTVVGSRTTYLVYNEVAPGETVPLRAGTGTKRSFWSSRGAAGCASAGRRRSSRPGRGPTSGKARTGR